MKWLYSSNYFYYTLYFSNFFGTIKIFKVQSYIQILILLRRLLEFVTNAPSWQHFEVKWLLLV